MKEVQEKEAAAYWKIAESVVDEMRARIKEVCRITASAGIATSFTLAKIASNVKKPDGQCLVTDPFDFMRDLPVRKVPGIGRITEKCIIDGLGAQTCQELYIQRARLCHVFTPHTALWLLMRSVGLDGGDESSKSSDRQESRKGMSKERTFEPVRYVECNLERPGLVHALVLSHLSRLIQSTKPQSKERLIGKATTNMRRTCQRFTGGGA